MGKQCAVVDVFFSGTDPDEGLLPDANAEEAPVLLKVMRDFSQR